MSRHVWGFFFFFTGKRNFFLPVQQNTDIRFRSYDYVNGLAMPTFFFFFFFLAEHSTRLVFITMVCLYSSNLFWSCSSCCYFCLVGERLFFCWSRFPTTWFSACSHVHRPVKYLYASCSDMVQFSRVRLLSGSCEPVCRYQHCYDDCGAPSTSFSGRKLG